MLRQRYADSGVSPVIGVILMVAITVILAATAASFFMSIGDQGMSGQVPTVAFDYTYDTDDGSEVLVIAHRGGDSLEADNLRVVVSGASCNTGADPNGRYGPVTLRNGETRLAAGSRLRLDRGSLHCGTAPGDRLDLSEATATVNWIGEDGTTSSTLWRWTGPSA